MIFKKIHSEIVQVDAASSCSAAARVDQFAYNMLPPLRIVFLAPPTSRGASKSDGCIRVGAFSGNHAMRFGQHVPRDEKDDSHVQQPHVPLNSAWWRWASRWRRSADHGGAAERPHLSICRGTGTGRLLDETQPSAFAPCSLPGPSARGRLAASGSP